MNDEGEERKTKSSKKTLSSPRQSDAETGRRERDKSFPQKKKKTISSASSNLSKLLVID